MLPDNLRQMGGYDGRRIYHRIAHTLRPLSLALRDPDRRQMERRLKGGNSCNLLLHIARVHCHIVVKKDFSLADLYSFYLDNILIRIELDIIPKPDNGNNRTKLQCNLPPDHNHAIQQISPLIHICKRNNAISEFQFYGVYLQQAVHILRRPDFFRCRFLHINLSLNLSCLKGR